MDVKINQKDYCNYSSVSSSNDEKKEWGWLSINMPNDELHQHHSKRFKVSLDLRFKVLELDMDRKTVGASNYDHMKKLIDKTKHIEIGYYNFQDTIEWNKSRFINIDLTKLLPAICHWIQVTGEVKLDPIDICKCPKCEEERK